VRAELDWVVPVCDAVAVVCMLAVALLGAFDVELRQDRRSLPILFIASATAVMWSGHFAVFPGDVPSLQGQRLNQATSTLFLIINLATPLMLAVALLIRGGPLPRPRRYIFLTAGVGVASGLAVIAFAVLSGTSLHTISPQGEFYPTDALVGVAGLVPAAIGLGAYFIGLHGDERIAAGVLAALTAGAAFGFLVYNFHPASVFMGDCGSNLLGLLLGATIVEGSLKTNALVALVVPLVVLAVPFLDTGFVVAKRIKYRRPVYRGDSNHFHHRFHRIGFSQRRTVLYLYAWTITMAGLAVALRFIPYSDDSGHLDPGWTAAMAACFVVALAASAYLVYVLEILKLRRLRAWQLRRADPQTTEHEIDSEVERELETGEFTALGGR
jgi:hypothetical protein